MGNSLQERQQATKTPRVAIGSMVRVRECATKEEWEMTLVGPDDADLDRARLSIDCPLGAALFGRRAGETIEVEAPAGRTKYRLLAVQFNE